MSLLPDDLTRLDAETVLSNMDDPVIKKRWEGSLSEMIEVVESALSGKVAKDQVGPLARHSVLAICETMGGSIVYLPRGERLRVAVRNLQIFNEWRNGRSPEALHKKYRLALQSVYEIISRQRALQRIREPDLFGFDDPKKDE